MWLLQVVFIVFLVTLWCAHWYLLPIKTENVQANTTTYIHTPTHSKSCVSLCNICACLRPSSSLLWSSTKMDKKDSNCVEFVWLLLLSSVLIAIFAIVVAAANIVVARSYCCRFLFSWPPSPPPLLLFLPFACVGDDDDYGLARIIVRFP